MAEENKDAKPTVENRWWAELGNPKERPVAKRDEAFAGDRFFKIAEGYDQDRARDSLTDQNHRLLVLADPPEGSWAYMPLLAERFPERELERIKQKLDLPAYARGVVVDCGRTIRLLVTGTPINERVLELALVEPPSFDCWVKGEWVREELYDNAGRALSQFRQHIRDYLAPEAIAVAESIRAQA